MLIVDSFAGGGGASTGIALALGRSPDIAINHNPVALAMHAANHPETLHLAENVWKVNLELHTGGRKVGLLWASPDCRHFSKARGGQPTSKSVRGLAWSIVRFVHDLGRNRPDVICLENVEEFLTWEDFPAWSAALRRLGYKMKHWPLRACDYGAPTIRKRLFIVLRRDGKPIIKPEPTHGDPNSEAVMKGRLKPWRTAAEIIDWSLPCPSIFDDAATIFRLHGLRAVRPLAANTMARVARGMKRYVLEAERPFLVNITHGGRVEPANEPLRTVTGAHRGEKAVISPSLTRFNGGATGQDMREPMPTVTANSWIKRPGGAPPFGVVAPVLTYAQQGGAVRRVDEPHHTVCASRKDQNSLIAAHVVRQFGASTGHSMGEPTGSVTAAVNKTALASAFLAQQNGGPRMGAHAGHDAREPVSTVAATGSQQTPVAAFFTKYYGTGDGARADEPVHTVTVRDRMGHVEARLAAPPFGPEHHERAREVAQFLRAHDAWDEREFVTVRVDGADYVIADIGMRMLTPRELFRAQGFDDSYVIDRDGEGRPIGKSDQIHKCGNSVCPPVVCALIEANWPEGRLDAASMGGRAQAGHG